MSKQINSVNVFSIDEEKLKFRITATFFAAGVGPPSEKGEYDFYLPPPTSLANDQDYSSCLIDCNGFQAYALGNVADPTWSTFGALSKVGALELQLDIPSSQTVTSESLVQPVAGVGKNSVGGYRELVFMKLDSVGDGAGNTVLAGRSAAWTGVSPAKPILCGNPFGKTLRIINHDPLSDFNVWLVSAAAGAGSADRGCYVYSFDITMIPNN